ADNYRLQDGDVLFARTGASVGKAYRYKASDGLVYFAGFLIRARIKPEYDTEFIFQSTLTDSYNRYVSITSQRSGQPGVNAQEYAEFELFVPKIDEQRQIGQLFKQLDRLLTLHQRKLELLKRLKQGYLQKLFPQNGENVPELRFKGYSDAWEKRKLKELGDTYSGLSGKTKEDFGHGEARYVTYMNVFTNPVADPVGTEATEIDTKQNEVMKNDVFFTTSSETPEEVGMSSVWPIETRNVYLNSFCFGYRVLNQSSLNFLFIAQQLRSPSFRKRMIILAQGISRYNISKKKVLEIPIFRPSLNEQNKIGYFLSNVDDLIAATQHKVDLLKKLKQGYLQKMFC
ncbi:restriction endonuclease, partial [Lacticaseibacillus rhamnosus]|uniref:restriction endonuclease subunit S n=2 Tax=Lacticaseibacillus rhamnosus TaxID=47715 RepID=UPI0007DFE686